MRFGFDRGLLGVSVALAFGMCASGLLASVAGAQVCSNEKLRSEQPFAVSLPDCRAYEVVSPLDKGDSDATAPSYLETTDASLSGDAVTYGSAGSFAQPEGSFFENQYLSRRGPDGWNTHSITPPFMPVETDPVGPYEAMLFTPELDSAVTSTNAPLSGEAEAGHENQYLVDLTRFPMSYRLVSNGVPLHEAYTGLAYQYADGASTDLSHVVYDEEGPSGNAISEWVDGKSSLVSVDPSGQPFNELVRIGELGFNGVFNHNSWRAVSSDGSRVYFSAAGGRYPRLFVRDGGSRTVEVSASTRTDCNVQRKAAEPGYVCAGTPEPDPAGPQAARYWGASVDGSRAFFTSCGKLTDNATAAADVAQGTEACSPGNSTGPGRAEDGNDLYEYDLNRPEGEGLRDLTQDDKDLLGARVLGVVDLSEDGSYVYFVAESALAAGAVSGEPNLYLMHAGAAPVFIATLAPSTEQGSQAEFGGDAQDWALDPAVGTVGETADGRRLAFLSRRSLTGYDNTDAVTGEPDAEVFSYDAGSGSLVCVSCNPSGARPIGPSSLHERFNREHLVLSGHGLRNFSDDGGRLFFDSRDALVPHDSNGRQDVYEYEGGHVYPVSDVAGNYESFFMDASPSGNDVFVATEDQLVPSDTDFHIDMFDARVGGGFPVTASPPACENGDSCKLPVSPQPGVFGPPPSATFAGAGNVAPVPKVAVVKQRVKPKRCGKRRVLKRGMCVRRVAGKSSRSGRSSAHVTRGR